MKVLTVRVPEAMATAIDDEYVDYGFESRADYIRTILQERDRIHSDDAPTATRQDPPDAESETAAPTQTLRSRVAELESRVDALESQCGSATDDGETPPPSEWEPVE